MSLHSQHIHKYLETPELVTLQGYCLYAVAQVTKRFSVNMFNHTL